MKIAALSMALVLTSASIATAQMNHDNMDHSGMQMSEEQMEGAVHAKANINSIGDGTANVSHEPIPEIGWPAMTMDLTVLEDAKMMGEVKPGDDVTLMLIQGDDGMYAISGIMPD